MATISHEAPSTAPMIKPVPALLLIVAVLGVCGVYIALNAALGTAEFFIGFFFLFYWAGLQKTDFGELPATALGSFFGLGLAFALQQLTARLGVAEGGLAFVAALIPVLYFFLRGQLTLVVNNATMLLLTVGAISHVQAHASFKGLFLSLAIAVAFFGGLLWAMEKIRSAAAARTARAAPAE